ncbi:hypothetical protein, partial [Streptomyces sp. NPDC048496]|uniref:hypothetical protein n=1 Tax=Streptomyces sp. NPDC048496 TaxID=3365558 RepID=UPI003721A456
MRSLSGTLIELHPSNDTVRYGPNRTPGVVGRANGPASTSNTARTGALPSLRRRSRSAFVLGQTTGIPDRPAV